MKGIHSNALLLFYAAVLMISVTPPAKARGMNPPISWYDAMISYAPMMADDMQPSYPWPKIFDGTLGIPEGIWPQQMTPDGWYYPTESIWTDNTDASWPDGIQNDHQPVDDLMSLGRIYGWDEPDYETIIKTQHMGIDVRAAGNASVYAIGDGVVDRIINTGGYMDDMIAVRHTTAERANIWAVYGHCRPRTGIWVGSVVTAGQDFAHVVDQANDHIHFGIKLNNNFSTGWGRLDLGLDPEIYGWKAPRSYLLSHPPRSVTISTLQNGGFESGTADPWVRFGDFDDMDDEIQTGVWHMGIQTQSGAYFAGSAASWSCKNGGFYQQVSAIPGQMYKLSAWVNTYQTSGSGNSAGNRIGIHPTGAIFNDPETIFWTPMTWTDAVWRKIAVPAVTSAFEITVFLYAEQLLPLEWNLNCFDDVTLIPVPAGSIGQIKTFADGQEVGLIDKIVASVIYQADGGFYLEEPDKSSAIRVITDQLLQTGSIVYVTGILGTLDGERVLYLTSILQRTTGDTPVNPVAMKCSDAGGISVVDGRGPSNVGMLIKVCGRVTSIDSGYFYINDGSLADEGLKIESANLTSPPAQNQYVSVTGICGLTGSEGNYRAVVRPRNQNDLMTYTSH